MEILLIRGLPGSGKSTIAKQMEGYVHCEADQFFESDGQYRFDASKLTEAHEACLLKARRAVEEGKSAVVANTFSRKWEAAAYQELAKEFGIDLRVIEAKGRFKNVHGVPDSVIQKMANRWETF